MKYLLFFFVAVIVWAWVVVWLRVKWNRLMEDMMEMEDDARRGTGEPGPTDP